MKRDTTLVSSSADLAAQHASAQLQVITPTAIAQTQGDSLTSFGYAIDNLINGSGLSDTPTAANLDTLTHSFGPTSVWVTQTQGDPTYFEDPSGHPDPQFTLTLDGPYSLSALAIWGYGGNTNEASDFTVEFSTDGGNSYSAAAETVMTSGLVGNDHARLAFDVAHETNFVRLTITNNAKGRGFPGSGGDRVGLGEIRFVGSAVEVITPRAIAQTQGDSLTGFSVAIDNLIDGSGLSDTPTTANLDTVTHDSGPTANYWATHTQGAPSYFEDPRGHPHPQFTLTLDGPYSLSALVVWGLSTNPGNEASDFAVEFSTDGGNSYSSATETLSLDNTTGGSAARLSFGQAHEANFVRLTITNNAKGRGFPGSGGDRVGLGEIRFVGGALAPNAPPVALAGTLVLVVNAIAGDDTVNIEEQAAGFAISGNTGSVGGVNVTVRVGTTELTATSSNDDPATWSVSVPGDAAYIAGPSVAVTVSAAKAGYTPPSAEVRPLAVDLVAPTAPTYAAPASLQVGVALAALSPTGGSGIDEYGATGLPPGLRIDPGTGVIGGTPDRANASTANATVRASDTAGNAATVPIAFPAVDTGDQALSGFRYSSDTVAFGSAAPTMTAPTGAQTTLSYSATPATVCTVDPTSGALTLEGVGSCEITATAAGTDDYDEATVTYTVTVHRAPPDQDDALTTILDMDTAAPELLIAPTAIAQTEGDTFAGYVIDNLINGSGLSDTPTATNLDTVTHSSGRTSAWATQTDGDPDYFQDPSGHPDPQFTLTLDGPYSLSALVIWGYGGNTNEASDFTVEFSTDGGNSYSTAAETVMTSGLVGNDHARLSFGQTHEANFVRLTMTNNAKGRGFPGSGGDRVGLGEIRFVGSAVQVITPRAIAQSAAQRTSEVITPTAIAQTAGDTFAGYAIDNLINGNGLSDTPTEANLYAVIHSSGSMSAWVTQTDGDPDYFGDSRDHLDPQFTLTLDGPYSLSELVLWGYGGNTNEASDFTVEFSTDGGNSYSTMTETVQTSAVLGNNRARLAFDVAREANFVRLTITNNAKGRGFPGAGGDRVGLGEIRFVGSAVAPELLSAVATGATLTLTYDKDLDEGAVPPRNAFIVTVNGTAVALAVNDPVTVLRRTVILTLASAVPGGATVTVTDNYDATATVTITATLPVDLVVPSLKLATVFDSTLTLTYDEPLDEGSVPSAGAFSVSVNNAPVSVVSNSVAVNNVTLRLASGVAAGSTVTVSYTEPAGNPIRDAAGNAAADLIARMVQGPPSDSTETETVVDSNLPAQNIIWTEIGDDSPRHGMPIGNGTYSALVWAARDDDILLLLGAGDFWDEYVHLNHPGRIRISYSTDPFASGEPFRQELKIKEAEIVITAGSDPEITTRIWADANEQVIHVESERTAGTGDYTMTVNFESLRPTTTVARTNPGNLSIRRNYSDMDESPYTPMKPADTMETVGNLVYWYQRNDQSYFDEIIDLQGLNASDYTDILTGRTYGGRLDGDGFTASGTAITKTGGSGRAAITLHSKVSDSVATWKTEINAAAIAFSTPIETLRAAHRDWWSKFWYRSYIFASGDSDATDLTERYILARYLHACAGRTPGMPIRFNGSIFTVGHLSTDWDHRDWNSYHGFNQRFVPWSMLPSGDFDLMQPHFDMFFNSLQMAKDRVSTWWGARGAKGAFWPEGLGLFGHVVGGIYGWDRTGLELGHITVNHHRALYTINVETVFMMLDYYDYSQDNFFATTKLIPVAREVVKFYFSNWEIDPGDGKLNMAGVNSGEEDRNLTNPMADIAGLHKVINGLLALPKSLTTDADRTYWSTVRGQLPDVPISANGRLRTSEDLELGVETNNQNLYAIFPYRLYGYGQANLEGATASYTNRVGKYPTSNRNAWRHDATHAAYLGLIDEAKFQVKGSLGRAPPGSWRSNAFYPGAPDGNPGVEPPAIGKIAFQAMLMHPGAGDNINLLNAWPTNWDVQFKLRAPKGTVVKGSRAGNHIAYTATPASRASDVSVRGSLTVNEQLALSVDAVAGDNVVDAAEKAAGFAIGGETGSVSGATVEVTLGGTALGSATSGSDGSWSVSVPMNAAYVTGNSLALRVTASRPGYLDPEAFERTLTFGMLGTLTLNVDVIAGDDTVNIDEKAAGFAISGDTASDGGVTVTVTVGTTPLTATSDDDDPATWSVSVPGNASYIAGMSVAVTVSAAKAGYTPPSAQARPLVVDLVAPVLQLATVGESTLTLTYNEGLATGSAPAVSAFTVKAGGTAVALASVNPVAVSSNTVTLTLASAVAADATVTVSYAAPLSNPVRDAAGNGTANLTDRSVGRRFGMQTTYSWSANPAARPFAGDFNDDGDADVGVWQPNGVWYIRYGDGMGSFGNETSYIWSSSRMDVQPVVGDFNGDGDADLLIFYEDNGAGGKWFIRYGDGTGSFGDEASYTWTGIDLHAQPFAADFDGDGNGSTSGSGSRVSMRQAWRQRTIGKTGEVGVRATGISAMATVPAGFPVRPCTSGWWIWTPSRLRGISTATGWAISGSGSRVAPGVFAMATVAGSSARKRPTIGWHIRPCVNILSGISTATQHRHRDLADGQRCMVYPLSSGGCGQPGGGGPAVAAGAGEH